MKKSKFTEAQIAFALKQSETGTRVEEVCRKTGISQATFFNWKKKYGGLGVSELRRLRQLAVSRALSAMDFAMVNYLVGLSYSMVFYAILQASF